MKSQSSGGDGLFVGFDIGSDSVHSAVLDPSGKIVYSPRPISHFANPMGALRQAWGDITSRFGEGSVRNTAFTGSGSEKFPEIMKGVTYGYDSVTIPKGARVIQPDVEYVFHIGAKDAYFFNLSDIGGMSVIREARPSSKCGGGSGTLVEKQCRRLLEAEVSSVDEMFARAEEMARGSSSPSEFLARCGVVIQSDLIHKQNEGVSKADNLAGLFETVARNYVIDVIGNKNLSQVRSIATGGVMANGLIRENLARLTGVDIERPLYFENVGAIGVAMKGLEDNNDFVFGPGHLDEVVKYGRESRRFAPALSLENVNESSESLEAKIESGTEVVIGIDGGSTTTKGAIVELSTGRLLDKLYIPTHGDSGGSLKKVLSYLSRHGEDIIVRGVATTGSARQLYQRMLVDRARVKELEDGGIEVADRVTDEITCHALGVKHYDSTVDTILEIGGQDMKYTRLDKDGTVLEAKMNYSCQAGGGQTLENMASIIGLDVKSTLQEAALRAKRIPLIDSTCGVFMEMDLNRLIFEGFSKDELAAAIVYGTASSYFHKFVGGSRGMGRNSSAQGGPALGKAFLAALAQVSQDKINAYPHREMFGAWGAALDVINNIKDIEEEGKSYDTAFRGWGVVDMEFGKKSVTCGELSEREGKNKCKVRDCDLEVYSIGDDAIVTGGFCSIGNSEAVKSPKVNYVDRFHATLNKHFKRQGVLLEELAGERDTIGIRRCTSTIGEKAIWTAALLGDLGFTPVITPMSDHEIARVGVDNSRTDFCMARKLATGHAALIRDHPGIEYSFNPSIIHQVQKRGIPMKYCIYTASEGFLLNDDLCLDKSRMINPIIEFGDVDSLVNTFYSELDRIGRRVSKRRIRGAIHKADEAEAEFNRDIFSIGDDFLKKTSGGISYLGIGRDYILLDPEASSHSGTMFAQTRGLDYIPQAFLKHRFAGISIEDIAPDEYWHESKDILRAQRYVAEMRGMYPIRMANFACGPDSIKIYQEEQIQRGVGKPMLVLLTDGQTNNAPFVTRIEAHERVVEQHHKNNK